MGRQCHRPIRCRHCAVELSIANQPTRAILETVRRGDAELGIVTLPVPTGRLCCEPLRLSQDVAILAPDHPLAARKRLRLTDLASEPWLMLDRTAHSLGGTGAY